MTVTELYLSHPTAETAALRLNIRLARERFEELQQGLMN